MGRPSTFSQEDLFRIYYLTTQAPETERKSTYDLAKKDPKERSQPTWFRSLQKITEDLEDADLRSEYEKWKGEQATPKFFYQLNQAKAREALLEIESPYSSVTEWARNFYADTKDKRKALEQIRTNLNTAQKVWIWLGKKSPANWTREDYNSIIPKMPQGSIFHYTVSMRSISKPLADIKGLTKGKKNPPKKIPLIATQGFPDLFKQIKQEAVNIAVSERDKDEIKLILDTKPSTGMRTGARIYEQGLWGTKIADGESPLELVGNDFTWTVREKHDEYWSINFKPEPFRSTLISFIRKYGLKKGDFLISISEERANYLLKEACRRNNVTELNLHSMRKVWISYLVRSGLPLEKAIKLNVGWKTIDVAFKHYLEFELLAEDIEEKTRRFGGLFQ